MILDIFGLALLKKYLENDQMHYETLLHFDQNNYRFDKGDYFHQFP
jgi:hypothetical protein